MAAPVTSRRIHSAPGGGCSAREVRVPYVDGFVVPVPKKNLKAYQRMARDAGKVWMEHGALQYWETVVDAQDKNKMSSSFGKGIKAKSGETVVFAWIVYQSRAHRNRVNAKVMKDPRM